MAIIKTKMGLTNDSVMYLEIDGDASLIFS